MFIKFEFRGGYGAPQVNGASEKMRGTSTASLGHQLRRLIVRFVVYEPPRVPPSTVTLLAFFTGKLSPSRDSIANAAHTMH